MKVYRGSRDIAAFSLNLSTTWVKKERKKEIII
jgi:hypothetical protein